MPALPAALGSQWLLGPTHAEMATTGVARFARPHPVYAGSPGKAWWRSNPRPLPVAATPTLGGGARYGRERVRKDSRPLDGLTGETPATNPNRMVHIVFLLDPMAIGLTGDVALSGTCGLVQDSYIEICR